MDTSSGEKLRVVGEKEEGTAGPNSDRVWSADWSRFIFTFDAPLFSIWQLPSMPHPPLPLHFS
jgi:hypothetical protein